ncbi:MAG: anti-sigma factor, partial [Deltaproteobacteria bacterium]|nr:anti-sigma factor [Deltaproteobacteria bacterium]
LAAAAAAVFAIAGYREIGHRAELKRANDTIAGLQQGLRATNGTLETVTATLAQREADLTALRLTLAQAQAALSVVQQRDLQMVALRETKDAPPAAGHVLLSPPTGKALFYAFDLPPVPPDRVYELWWITEKDGPVRAAVFHPDERGVGRVEALLPTGAGALQAAAVTVERAGGVPKPEGPMVLLGPVKS